MYISYIFLGMCRKEEVSEPAKENLLKSLEEMPAIVQNPPKRPRHVPDQLLPRSCKSSKDFVKNL
jgi:hypothetical protein